MPSLRRALRTLSERFQNASERSLRSSQTRARKLSNAFRTPSKRALNALLSETRARKLSNAFRTLSGRFQNAFRPLPNALSLYLCSSKRALLTLSERFQNASERFQNASERFQNFPILFLFARFALRLLQVHLAVFLLAVLLLAALLKRPVALTAVLVADLQSDLVARLADGACVVHAVHAIALLRTVRAAFFFVLVQGAQLVRHGPARWIAIPAGLRPIRDALGLARATDGALVIVQEDASFLELALLQVDALASTRTINRFFIVALLALGDVFRNSNTLAPAAQSSCIFLPMLLDAVVRVQA